MDVLAGRLRDAGTALLGLRGALVAGEPWPLSEHWGTEPEADWGPREVLAHVNEMGPYWTDQLDAVIAEDPATMVPFGRVATDPERLARIGADRVKPVDQLLDEIQVGLTRAATFVTNLAAADGERMGLHPRLGELAVRAAVERFLVTHLEDHVTQLHEILARRATA